MTEPSHSEDAKPGPPKKRSHPVRRMLLLVLAVYLMFVSLLTYFQRSLIYQPHPCGRLLASQAGLPFAAVDVTVKSFDGLDLHGWLALAGSRSRSDVVDVKQALSDGRPVVLFFPGNAGDRSVRDIQMSIMSSLNVHTLIVDYRGYADNGGKPTEENFARDARSVWNYLTVDLGVAPRRVVIYGESLGGGVAIRLASELCQAGSPPCGLIAQSTFNSLVAVAQAHFPVLPVSLILVDRFPSDTRIPHVTCPILQIHGQQDSIVPFKYGQRLFDAAPAKSKSGIAKRQYVMPHTDHNDVYSDSFDQNSNLVAELKQFFEAIE